LSTLTGGSASTIAYKQPVSGKKRSGKVQPRMLHLKRMCTMY